MNKPLALGCTVLRDTIVVAEPSLTGSPTLDDIPLNHTIKTPHDVLRLIAARAERLADQHIATVGIAIGGHVNPKTGRVVYAPALAPKGQDWTDISVKSDLEALTGLPVFLDNDVNCMVYHYAKTSASVEEGSNIIAVYIAPEGHGLGSGIIAGGNLLRGMTGGAGEFGHVIVQPTGARCRCGSRGCLEALLSAANITREINWGRRNNVRTLAEAAHLVTKRDSAAISAFTRAGRNFGQGLAVLINLFNPASIVVGGPEPFLGQDSQHPSATLFQTAFNDAVTDYAFSDMSNCRITIARLDPFIAASGAALMATDMQRT